MTPTPFLPPSQSQCSFSSFTSIHLPCSQDIYTVVVINKETLILLCSKKYYMCSQDGVGDWASLVYRRGWFFASSRWRRMGGAEVMRET